MATATNVAQQGWGQATAAMQSLMRSGLGARGATSSPGRRPKRRSAKRAAKRASPRRSSSRKASSSRGGRLKAGSAAAKAWGRKMKALRKRG